MKRRTAHTIPTTMQPNATQRSTSNVAERISTPLA
jgi:hypothetical protein